MFQKNNFLTILIKNRLLIKKLQKYIVLLNNLSNQTLIIKLLNIKNRLNIVTFIISFIFKKSNIFVHITDCLGNQLYFYSVGYFGYTIKKNKTTQILQKFIKTIFVKLKFLINNKVVIHLVNINYTIYWLLNKLYEKLLLINIKIFNCFSYNGCRKKKLKRIKV